jgi:HD-like signal output (HDOD) protein
MNAREIAEQASDLFVLSDSFVRIKDLIDDESSTIDDIADIIMLDPALSATTLKLANSSFFNYPGKIDSISKALLVLGITEVYNLVIAYFTRDAFRNLALDKSFLETFWEQSVDCALFVRFLGGYLQVPHAERLFILGLLHNLGELLVHQFAADEYAAYQQKLAHSTDYPWQVQQQEFGFSFGQCSAELLKFWSLPYCLIEPIYEQDQDNFEFMSKDCKILYAAKRMAIHLQDEYSDKPLIEILSLDKQQELRIDAEFMTAIRDYCDIERFAILALLNPGASMIY